MAERDAEIAQHGRVGEVALQRETGSFSAKCASSALARPRLPSAFSKSIGIDLVRHGRGADFAGDRLLPEIAERDVAPHVAREVEQHGVGAQQRMAVLGDPVVRLDLGGVGIRLAGRARRRSAR